MKALLFFVALPAFAADAPQPAIQCQAIYRTLDAQKNTVERSVPLTAQSARSGQKSYEATLEGKTFSLVQDLGNGDLLGQIIAGPDYTKGTVFRGTADSLGRFNASEVDGVTVYRLECTRAQR